MAAGLAGAAAACLIRRCQRLGAAPRPGTGRRHCGAAPLDEMRRAQLRELRLAEVDLLCLLTRQRGVMDASDGGAGEEGENRGKAWRSPAWEKSVEATLRKKVTWRGCDLSGETARERERGGRGLNRQTCAGTLSVLPLGLANMRGKTWGGQPRRAAVGRRRSGAEARRGRKLRKGGKGSDALCHGGFGQRS